MPQVVPIKYHLRHVVSMPQVVPIKYHKRHVVSMPRVAPNRYHSRQVVSMPRVVPMKYHLRHAVSMPGNDLSRKPAAGANGFLWAGLNPPRAFFFERHVAFLEG